jgi:hypothetical protein
MRYFTICAMLVAALLLVAGCAKQTVVGKWSTSVETQTMFGKVKVDQTLDFKTDGSLDIAGTAGGTPFTGTGSWTMDSDSTLHIQVKTLKAGGKDQPVPPQQAEQSGKVEFGKNEFKFNQSMGGATVTSTFTKVQ